MLRIKGFSQTTLSTANWYFKMMEKSSSPSYEEHLKTETIIFPLPPWSKDVDFEILLDFDCSGSFIKSNVPKISSILNVEPSVFFNIKSEKKCLRFYMLYEVENK